MKNTNKNTAGLIVKIILYYTSLYAAILVITKGLESIFFGIDN